MVKTIVKDILFLGQKSVPATPLDMNVVMIFGIHWLRIVSAVSEWQQI